MARRVPEVLALIPARGGSKSIPRKNLVPIGGLPLIGHTIRAALDAKTITRVVVSTDDEEIANVSQELGAEIPFLRPVELAQDETPSVAVARHALSWLEESEGYKPDVLALLQPTSPLRQPEDIDAAVWKLMDTGCDSVVTITPVHQHPLWMFRLQGDRLEPFLQKANRPARRQDLPPLYCLNGAVYVTRPHVVFSFDSLLGGEVRAVLMPRTRSVDIDDQIDLVIASALLMRAVHGETV